MHPTFAKLEPKHIPWLLTAACSAQDPWTESDLLAELKVAGNVSFVVLNKNAPIGFACFSLHADLADLRMVAIEPASQRQGIGFALLCFALHELATKGAVRCLLEVRKTNHPAILLYQKLGFCTLAKRAGLFSHPAEDGIAMELSLSGFAANII